MGGGGGGRQLSGMIHDALLTGLQFSAEGKFELLERPFQKVSVKWIYSFEK